ncbi:MAG: hypothetical protein OCD76_01730 [Reichenbachiella sp.]
MNLKTFVKVGTVSNLSDARYCAGFGVDMIGFNLDTKKEDAISVKTAKEIMGWIAGTEFLIEYGNLSLDEIKSIQTELDIKTAQTEGIETANSLVKEGIRVFFQYDVTTQDHLDELKDVIGSLNTDITEILVNCNNAELFAQLDQILLELGDRQVIKGYNIDADTVLQVINDSNIKGIALTGSHEDKPGFKDYDELADILELLDNE